MKGYESLFDDSNYKRVQYTRYADDFIIGVIGSKADAEAIKKDVKIFLQETLKLEMSFHYIGESP